jgi:hypothetical protein
VSAASSTASPAVSGQDRPTPGRDTAALPVALDVAGRHGEGVRRWVEGVLGWQTIDPATADVVPAALRLFDLASETARREGRRAAGGRPGELGGPAAARVVPSALLVDGDDDPADVAALAARVRPDLVVAWPEERGSLLDAVAALLAEDRTPGTAVRVLRIGGSAGGVGTSTVALALAGLSSWSGARTLVAVGRTAPVGDALPVAAAAVAAPDLWRRATALAGVPRARVVRLAEAGPLPDPGCTDLDLAILDVGVAPDVDVLVCRADAAVLDAASATTAAAVVVVGEGPASHAAVRRACGDRRLLTVPVSARVARAGLHRRVPTALPGAWLRALTELAPRGPTSPIPG